ncbi:hypothetical protein DY000_02031079 [Brassica cretica]|uniref:Uncharacterized protein n=1 Tax=Brassica cretica TaxID=69181 RepID=A0ABQ7DQM7_BRACR|nr:hypothetical protein DY000_02031079 [Brassica cretica]
MCGLAFLLQGSCHYWESDRRYIPVTKSRCGRICGFQRPLARSVSLQRQLYILI